MFSIKVITAIKIIQELEPLLDKREARTSRRCVISFKELPESGVSTAILKSILSVMMKSGWIDKISRGYFLLINPDTLTLYSIYNALHGGLPLGEVANSRWSNPYPDKGKYEKLEQIEAQIKQQLVSQFKDISFADMRTIM